jgi:hypothetical protein
VRSSVATSPEQSRSRPRRPSTRWLATKIAAVAAALSLALGVGLSWQMTRGADPALRPKAIAAATTTQPSRRIVKTVVIKRVVASPASASSTPVSSTGSSPVATAAPAPVTTATS